MSSIDAVLEGASCEELEKVVISDDKEKFSRSELYCPLKRGKS